MSIKHLLGVAAVVCAALSSPPAMNQAASAEDFTPKKQSLTIPITMPSGRSLECVVSFGPAVPISAVAFSPDGKTLAVGGYQEVLLWDLAAGELARRLGVGVLGGQVGAVAFDPEGKLLAVGEGTPNVSGVVKVFDVEKGEVTASFEEPTDVVYSVAFSPDGKLLVASGAYEPVHVWNVAEKKLATTLEGNRGWVLDVAFDAEGKLLATSSADRTLRVWSVENWEPATKFVLNEAVQAAAFGADTRILAAAVFGPGARGIQLRRTDNLRYTRSFYMPGVAPLDVCWDVKKNRIYAACSNGTVRVFDGNGRSLATLTGHDDWVYGIALSADGTRIATGSGDGTVKLWNTADNKLLATLVQLAPRAEDWLIVTDQGYLAASSTGEIQWKTTNVKTPAEEITAVLKDPELVRKAIAGEKTEAPTLE